MGDVTHSNFLEDIFAPKIVMGNVYRPSYEWTVEWFYAGSDFQHGNLRIFFHGNQFGQDLRLGLSRFFIYWYGTVVCPGIGHGVFFGSQIEGRRLLMSEDGIKRSTRCVPDNLPEKSRRRVGRLRTVSTPYPTNRGREPHRP